MEQKEKNMPNITTDTAQKVSTKTKTLLSVTMILAVSGILAFAGIFISSIKKMSFDQTTKTQISTKSQISKVEYYNESDKKLINQFVEFFKKQEPVEIELSDGLKIKFDKDTATTTTTSPQYYSVRFSEDIEPILKDDFIRNNAKETDALLAKVDKFSKTSQISELPIYNVNINDHSSTLKTILIERSQGTTPRDNNCTCGIGAFCLNAASHLCGDGSVDYDYGGGITCFAKDTDISIETGSKKIQDIKIGDLVKSYDVENKKITYSRVINLFKDKSDEYIVINNNWKVTSEHPFWINGKNWKKASDIVVGDTLMTEDQQFIKVESLNKIHKSVDVYNIQTDTGNYFANGALVHNKSIIVEGHFNITGIFLWLRFTFHL